MNNLESNFAAWLHKADHELLNINNNLAARQIPWDTICFHAQQITPQAVEHARRTWFWVLLPKQKDLAVRGRTPGI